MECICYNCERERDRLAKLVSPLVERKTSVFVIDDIVEPGTPPADDWAIGLWSEWDSWRRAQARDATGVAVNDAPGAAP